MEGNNLLSGGEYAESLNVLRTIILEHRYEDFYNGLQVNLLGQDADNAGRGKYYEKIVLPFVRDYVIGKRLHGDKLIGSWQAYFRSTMAGKSWEEIILDSMANGADAFAVAVKGIQKNIDDFSKRER